LVSCAYADMAQVKMSSCGVPHFLGVGRGCVYSMFSLNGMKPFEIKQTISYHLERIVT